MQAKVTIQGHSIDEVKAALKHADVTTYLSFEATDGAVSIILTTSSQESVQSHAVECVNALRFHGIAAEWAFEEPDDDGS